MAWEQPGFKITSLEAPSTAFGNRQYYGVAVSSSSPFIKIPTNNVSSSESPLGILQNQPTITGEEAEVQVTGVSKAFCVGAVLTGKNFIFSTSGAITAASNGSALDTHWGPVLVGASSGELATVLIRPIGVTT